MKTFITSTLGAMATVLFATNAHAAVTVLGGGSAEACYQAAEHGSKDLVGSIKLCDTALSDIMLPRDRAATLVNRGILRLAMQDASGSLADFNRGLTINDRMGEGYVNRGASLILMHRYDEALADINKGMAMGSRKLEIAYYDRGMANEALGNLSAAYADYKQATVIDPYFQEPANELKRFHVVTKPAGT
jgi:tetratricopeptide (TPR) repeat protein